MRYRLSKAVRHESHSAALGTITVEFEAGEIEPKSEQEEEALKRLEEAGLAKALSEPKSRTSRKDS